jgi:quinone-modifying oxidoreductase subunit QmoA
LEGPRSADLQDPEGGVLVIGGGIAGVTAALEAAESGAEVHLVEKSPFLGGRVLQLARYYPKLCPPACGLEINFRRLKDNPRIHVLTTAEVEDVSGASGRFDVRVRIRARHVNDRCTACGACLPSCPVERPDPSNHGMSSTRAIHGGSAFSYPHTFAIDPDACLFDRCGRCVPACPYGAIDLAMRDEVVQLRVGAIVVATGWEPYDARAIANLGFGRHRNVVTNMMFERMGAADGPTGGRIVRPSDGGPARRVAFVQCAGSRDRLHLPYCSGVCCLASLKQATYVLDQYPDAEVSIFYIDLRTPGTHEAFAERVLARGNVRAIKGKVADVLCDPGTEELTVVADDMLSGGMSRTRVDLVVLAGGMVPSLRGEPAAGPIGVDGFGFAADGVLPDGIFAAGCARAPADVTTATSDGTAAAMMALRAIRRSRAAKG